MPDKCGPLTTRSSKLHYHCRVENGTNGTSVYMFLFFSLFSLLRYYRQDLYRDCVIYQPGIFVLHEAKALIKGGKYVRVYIVRALAASSQLYQGWKYIFPSRCFCTFSHDTPFSKRCFRNVPSLRDDLLDFSINRKINRNRRAINFEGRDNKGFGKGRETAVETVWFEIQSFHG